MEAVTAIPIGFVAAIPVAALWALVAARLPGRTTLPPSAVQAGRAALPQSPLSVWGSLPVMLLLTVFFGLWLALVIALPVFLLLVNGGSEADSVVALVGGTLAMGGFGLAGFIIFGRQCLALLGQLRRPTALLVDTDGLRAVRRGAQLVDIPWSAVKAVGLDGPTVLLGGASSLSDVCRVVGMGAAPLEGQLGILVIDARTWGLQAKTLAAMLSEQRNSAAAAALPAAAP